MGDTIDIGIDLGTTNSSIACCHEGTVRVFQNMEMSGVTPSVVYLGKTGRIVVGRKAYDAWPADPQNTQAEFKRWMGFDDKLSFPASGKSLSAEELSAEVLKSLRADAGRHLGHPVDASVITVPAAFGSLQCEATGRAAKLAGFNQAPLLQEPIAAAIAYGASPNSRNQRWMVFDLGGGTLDIAVVSTRNGRLAVLDHEGDNRLGGKDMDQAIAREILLPRIAGEFRLPDRQGNPTAYDRLLRGLYRNAEQAKIALSTSRETMVELFDLGNDLDGKPIEAPITVTRAEMESKIKPLIERCLSLANRALDQSRISASDLDRILLVGGPTHMPIIRDALYAAIGSKLDTSLDPMTVVSQGAALFASTIERTAKTVVAAPDKPVPASAVPIQLSYERASGTMQSPVAGLVNEMAGVHEVRIDAAGGFWSSGWVPLENGCFQVDVSLQDKSPVTKFRISARGPTGSAIVVTPAEFSITYMLPMAAPPLPHTIAVEVSSAGGDTKFDPIFKRHCPLPAEARRTYRAERTLRPSDADATLPIKFWEIDLSDDPQEKWWSGCVHVRADKIRRLLPEGSEIELTIKIDQSRKLEVEVFIPILNETFVDGVYIPDPPSARDQLQQQLDLCFERIDRVFRDIFEGERDDLLQKARSVQAQLESIAEQTAEDKRRGITDPDAALGPSDHLRKIRIQLAQLEEQLESTRRMSTFARKVASEARWTESLVANHGSDIDKQEMAKLSGQFNRYSEADDNRGLRWVQEQMRDLRINILDRQPWFWQNWLHFLKRPGRKFVHQAEAEQWIARAETAEASQNLPELRKAINHAAALLPPDQVEAARDQAAQSGLRTS